MLLSYAIDATGLAALALNVSGYVRTNDRHLRTTTGWASALWALNNLLLGAHSAAALGLLSAGRQATAEVVMGQARIRAWACAAFVLFTLTAGVLTWDGWVTVATTTGSLIATVAMFYLRGMALRLAMVMVAALWMTHAIVFDSWWQMAANGLAGAAALGGAWRTRRGA